MPKKFVPLVTGETYHVFNRGVDKRKIFLDKNDYFRFHRSLQLFNAKEQTGSIFELSFKDNWIDEQEPLVEVNAYCLLGNHFHLILTQKCDGGISEFMKRLGGGYTSYFNEKYDRSGALFQGNFKRVHCESNEQLLYLASYVNLNNLVHMRSEYSLSSFTVYNGERQESFVFPKLILSQYNSPKEFSVEAEKTVKAIAHKRKIDKKYDKENLFD